MGGVEKAAPVMAGLFLVFGLAALGLPGLSPFVSEMLVIIAAFQHHWWTGAIAVTAIVLAAFYVLWMYQRTMTGPELTGAELTGPELTGADLAGPEPMGTGIRPAVPAAPRDLGRREVGTLAPLFLALVLFGFYPMPLLNVINPFVQDTLQQVGVTDPGPTVPVAQNDGGQQ
jgi:NADH-quinone oxidoreductase subunit M